MTSADDRVTRARLLSLLSEACELEHALACSYLYAAFSIKRELREGIGWAAQQRNRTWASRIYHVAAQEMLHLGQAWNLLTAVGGTPYYARANFPLAARHYPLPVALILKRFDLSTMDRFVYYESPANNISIDDDHNSAAAERSPLEWPIDESFGYKSVGQLYGEIRRIINTHDERSLFLRSADGQTGESLTDFPDIVAVRDRASANAAIDMITEQGEGSVDDREDSHYGVFTAIRSELEEVSDNEDVARPVAENPYVRLRRDQIPVAVPDVLEGIVATEITDEAAIQALDLFDDIYVSMLQGMAFAYANSASTDKAVMQIARAALELMTTTIKPLGEGICLLPSGHAGVNAGPTFALSRHCQLPALHEVSRVVYGERLAQLAVHAQKLTTRMVKVDLVAADQIKSAAVNLQRLADEFVD